MRSTVAVVRPGTPGWVGIGQDGTKLAIVIDFESVAEATAFYDQAEAGIAEGRLHLVICAEGMVREH